jgi:4-hydroxy-2-oxoheptanedioate aldolase
MNGKMRPSKVLKKLRAGEKVCCIKINLADPRVPEIAAIAGFDCVWIDQEHIGTDWSVVESCIWATKAHNTDLLVRVARGSYSDYIRPLELDASGIMVPHVMSADDARNVVQVTRFHPVGMRPIDGGNADAAYTAVDFNEYLRQANEERFVILQIEDKEALQQLETIAALPGYDMLFFGPGDFSQSIGAPGDWNNPQIQSARKQVAAAALKYGKFAGTVAGPDNLEEMFAMGYQFVSIGADVVGLKNYFQNLAGAFHQSPANEHKSSYLEN